MLKELLEALPDFARCNRLKKCNILFESGEEKPVDDSQTIQDAGLADANLISSEVVEGLHIPLLDIDMDAALLPSSTHGHHHLYINKPMPLEDLKKLVRVMVEVGVVQQGVLNGLEGRGFTSLRLPHVKKESNTKPDAQIFKGEAIISKEDTEKSLQDCLQQFDNSEWEW